MTVKSNVVSEKLFQIIFNRHNFIEAETSNTSDKTNQLTKKIKKLILTESTKKEWSSSRQNNNCKEFDAATNYYLKLSKFKSTENVSHLLKNGHLKLKFFISLNLILKKNVSYFTDLGNHNPLQKLEKNLLENILQIYSILSKQASERNVSSDEELLLGELNFNMLHLMSTLNLVFLPDENIIRDLFARLFGLLSTFFWPSTSCFTTMLHLNELSLSNISNTLVISQLLIKLLANDQLSSTVEIKHEMLDFFKSESFVNFIALIMLESNNISHEYLAQEICINLNEISKANEDMREAFSLERILTLKHKLKKETAKSVKYEPINVLKYAFESNPFPSSNKEIYFEGTKKTNDNNLDKLVNVYERKITEQARQNAQMVNTVNECYSKILANDLEHQHLRGFCFRYLTRFIELFY